MPEFAVNSDETSATSSQLISDFGQLQDKLSDVRNKIESLLANGYRTPQAQQKFQPYFEEFAKGFEQVNASLEGIGTYVRTVGEAFSDTDTQLGSQLG